jgi:hypothetical protein
VAGGACRQAAAPLRVFPVPAAEPRFRGLLSIDLQIFRPIRPRSSLAGKGRSTQPQVYENRTVVTYSRTRLYSYNCQACCDASTARQYVHTCTSLGSLRLPRLRRATVPQRAGPYGERHTSTSTSYGRRAASIEFCCRATAGNSLSAHAERRGSISKRTAPHWECRIDRRMWLSGPGGLAAARCVRPYGTYHR